MERKFIKFSDEFIEKIRSASKFVELVSQHTQLKRSGNRWFGLCPFPDHKEKTPSFSVDENRQIYYCFGCKKGGDIFSFAQEFLTLSFPESVEYLANKAGIQLPQDLNSQLDNQHHNKETRNSILEINRIAASFYQQQLRKTLSNNSTVITKFLENRCLSSEIVKNFQLGYAPDGWEFLVRFLSERYPLSLLEKSGLIKRKIESKDGHYDLFRNRFIFPIFSPSGEVLAFGGRSLSPDDNPKYLNSPETIVFHKGSVFYGLHASAKFIRSKDQVIIVEGYMDFLSLYGAGIQNVVATLGTSLTVDHMQILKRLSKNVVVLFDGDPAGKKAAQKSLILFLNAGLNPKALYLPSNVDPDEFVIKKGGRELQKLINDQVVDLFFLQVDRSMETYKGTATDKLQVVESLSSLLNQIKDPLLKQLYIQDLCQRLSVEEKWMNQALYEKRSAFTKVVEQIKSPLSTHSSMEKKISLVGAPIVEIDLLGFVLKKEIKLNSFIENGGLSLLSHEGVIQSIQWILNTYNTYNSSNSNNSTNNSGSDTNNFALLLSSLYSKLRTPNPLITRVEEKLGGLDGDVEERYWNDCLKKLKLQRLAEQERILALEIKEMSSQQTLERFMNIQKQKKTISEQ